MNKVKKILTGNLTLSALLLIAVGLVLSIIAHFRFAYGTNDDYALSLLMNGGEERMFFISYYVGFFFSHLQQLFPAVNCYGISQIVLGAAALLAVNYVLFCRLGKILGAFVSLLADILLYSATVMIVQFTQTTTLVCAAGSVLLLNARFFEERKGFRRLQYGFSAFLIIVSSLYRFMSFRVVAVFSFILLFCVLLGEIYREATGYTALQKILAVLKKQWKFLLCFVLIFAVCFGGNILSNMLKNADPSYVAHADAEEGRSLVTDYPLANYWENKDFYRENNIYSARDVVLINRGQIDPEVMDTESLTNIGKFSAQQTKKRQSNISYAISSTLKNAKAGMWKVYDGIIFFKQFCPIQMSYRVFVIGFVLLCAILLALLIVLWTLLRRKLGFAPLIYGSVPLKLVKILLALTWVSFFTVYGFSLMSCLLLPVCGIALLTLRNANWLHTVYGWIITLVSMGLYGYQVCFRLNFRSTYIFAVPAFLFLCFLFDKRNMAGLKDSTQLVKCISAAIPMVLAVVILCNVQPLVWRNNVVARSGVYPTTIYDYIADHPDTTYAMVVPCAISIDPNYNNAVLPPDMPENTLFYGSWNIYSDYNEKQMKEKGIDALFADLINNEHLQLVVKSRDDYTRILTTYFNDHYAHAGKTIRVEEVKKINNVGSYLEGIKQNDPMTFYQVIEE